MAELTSSPNRIIAFVDEKGRLLKRAAAWAKIVTLSLPIVGEGGDPEDRIEGTRGQWFIDTDAAVGASYLYNKQVGAVGGDKKKGWRLVL